MNKECRDEITLIEANCLYEAIEVYLRKYKYDKPSSHSQSIALSFFNVDSVQNVD